MEIKIIDLLDKIANNEELPHKIVYHGIVYVFDDNNKEYIEENGFDLLFSFDGSLKLDKQLNEKVNILGGSMVSYYELLGMIKCGVIPKQVKYKETVYKWIRGCYSSEWGETIGEDILGEEEALEKNIEIIEEEVKFDNDLQTKSDVIYARKLTEKRLEQLGIY